MRSAALVLLGLVWVGCGPNLATSSEQDDTQAEVDGALRGELKAQVPSFTVWVRPALSPEVRGGRAVYVLRGRTSQNLDGVNAYVFDDPLGSATVLSPRTFEVVFDSNSEVNTVAAGIRLFLGFSLTGTTPPATAALVLRPVFTTTSSTGTLVVTPEVLPLAKGEGLTYRTRVDTGGAPLSVMTKDGASFTPAKRSATAWNVDVDFLQLRSAFDEKGELVTFTSGASMVKAGLAVTVTSFELKRGDVETNWPPLQCTPALQACLDALPGSATDSEPCGTYYPVNQCRLPWRGVTLFNSPDDVTALNAAVASINASLPATHRVAYRAYGVMEQVGPSQVARVLAGWKAREPYGDLQDGGSLTATTMRNQLTAFGQAQGLIPAAQQVVYQQSFVGWRYTRPGGTTLYALFFSSASRLIILETVNSTR